MVGVALADSSPSAAAACIGRTSSIPLPFSFPLPLSTLRITQRLSEESSHTSLLLKGAVLRLRSQPISSCALSCCARFRFGDLSYSGTEKGRSRPVCEAPNLGCSAAAAPAAAGPAACQGSSCARPERPLSLSLPRCQDGRLRSLFSSNRFETTHTPAPARAATATGA